MIVETFEKSTAKNFSIEGYLLANADVRRAQVDPAEHFQMHGLAEGRRQINQLVFQHDSEYRQEKSRLFRSALAPELANVTLPHVVGKEHYELNTYDSESANDDFGPFVEYVDANPTKLFLDLGAGLRRNLRSNCLYVEVYPSLTADLVVSPQLPYPIKSGSLDGVGCFAVLEHVRRPWEVVAEMKRVLKPGGKVFIDWPFLQPVHGYPSHYFNATREGVRSLFEDVGFRTDELTTQHFQGPDYSVHWLLWKLAKDIPDAAAREVLLNMSVRDLVDLPPGGDRWKWLISSLSDETRAEFACGNCLIASKL